MRLPALIVAVTLATGCYLTHGRSDAAPARDASPDRVLPDAAPDSGRDTTPDTTPPPPPPPRIVFDREIDPIFLAVDDASFYWVNRDRAVMTAPKVGGEVRTLQGPLMVAWNLEIFLDGDFVYLYADDEILQLPKDGSLPNRIETRLPGPHGTLAFDEDLIYFAEAGCEMLGFVRRDGSFLASVDVPEASFGGGQTSLAVGGARLYCSNGPRIYSMSRDLRGTPFVFVDGENNLSTLKVDAERLYWLDNSLTPGRSRNVSMANLEDGIVIDLVEDTGISGWLDLDPARRELFWVDGSRATRPDRAIHRFGVDAREHDLLAERRVAQGGIAYDEEYVYWTELGSIERVAR